MKPLGTYLPGNVLPTVVVATVLMLAGIAGLLALWEHETLLFARSCRLRQARADAESAYALYRLYPACPELTGRGGYLLYDSLPLSRVFVEVRPWGLYETVTVTTSDSLLRVCRLCGAWRRGRRFLRQCKLYFHFKAKKLTECFLQKRKIAVFQRVFHKFTAHA